MKNLFEDILKNIPFDTLGIRRHPCFISIMDPAIEHDLSMENMFLPIYGPILRVVLLNNGEGRTIFI